MKSSWLLESKLNRHKYEGLYCLFVSATIIKQFRANVALVNLLPQWLGGVHISLVGDESIIGLQYRYKQ